MEKIVYFNQLNSVSSHSLLQFFSSQYGQSYFALTVYFLLAVALCGLLAGLAYLFSISTAQETEKRSEYECGFAPFDSATRLPFDVHFYLVGILFLIFDVEVALLFPWVLSLRTVGWFGFYLMFAFLFILTIGFLYEWKRGALIWPTRYSKVVKTARNYAPVIIPSAAPEVSLDVVLNTLSQCTDHWLGNFFAYLLAARVFAWLYTKILAFDSVPVTLSALTLLFAIWIPFLLAVGYSSRYHCFALVFTGLLGYYSEGNPFFPSKVYEEALVTLIGLPFLGFYNPRQEVDRLWAFACCLVTVLTFTASVLLIPRAYDQRFAYTGYIHYYWRWFDRVYTWSITPIKAYYSPWYVALYRWLTMHPRCFWWCKADFFYLWVCKPGLRDRLKTLASIVIGGFATCFTLATITTVFLPAKELLLYITPLASSLNYPYDAFGVALFLLTTYCFAFCYSEGMPLQIFGKTYRHKVGSPTIFGLHKQLVIEGLSVVYLVIAGVVIFTNALVYANLATPLRHLLFINIEGAALLSEAVPEAIFYVSLIKFPWFVLTEVFPFIYIALPKWIDSVFWPYLLTVPGWLISEVFPVLFEQVPLAIFVVLTKSVVALSTALPLIIEAVVDETVRIAFHIIRKITSFPGEVMSFCSRVYHAVVYSVQSTVFVTLILVKRFAGFIEKLTLASEVFFYSLLAAARLLRMPFKQNNDEDDLDGEVISYRTSDAPYYTSRVWDWWRRDDSLPPVWINWYRNWIVIHWMVLTPIFLAVITFSKAVTELAARRKASLEAAENQIKSLMPLFIFESLSTSQRTTLILILLCCVLLIALFKRCVVLRGKMNLVTSFVYEDEVPRRALPGYSRVNNWVVSGGKVATAIVLIALMFTISEPLFPVFFNSPGFAGVAPSGFGTSLAGNFRYLISASQASNLYLYLYVLVTCLIGTLWRYYRLHQTSSTADLWLKCGAGKRVKRPVVVVKKPRVSQPGENYVARSAVLSSQECLDDLLETYPMDGEEIYEWYTIRGQFLLEDLGLVEPPELFVEDMVDMDEVEDTLPVCEGCKVEPITRTFDGFQQYLERVRMFPNLTLEQITTPFEDEYRSIVIDYFRQGFSGLKGEYVTDGTYIWLVIPNEPFTLCLELLLDTLEGAGEISTVSFLGEALLFFYICVVLIKLSVALGKDHNKRALASQSAQMLSTAFLIASAIYLYQLIAVSATGSVFGGYFAVSKTITLLKLVTLLSALFVLDSSETFMRRHVRHLLEYPVMLALTTLFMLLLISANHIMSSFLSLVGFSLGLYVLILYDANQRPSREAGLKYYYLSTLSSGFILYGMLLVYSLTGTGDFDELFYFFNTTVVYGDTPLIRVASVIILAGFFFKLSAFPGHLWAADVYEGSPAPITGFFMLPVKVAVLGGFIRLFTVAFAPLAAYWLPLLTAAVVISILWGAFASVQEKKVRRFLAYASINQMGFLLMGLTTDSDEGFRAALLYILVYAVMTCAFLTIFLSARKEDGSELLYISDFRTLASRNWLVGWSLAIVLFSMAGIPPLGGFFAKYFVLLHAFEKGLMLEVIVGLATSLISTYYYLRIIKIVKFEQPDGAMPSSPNLTVRRRNQLFAAEAILWSFIVFAPAIIAAITNLSHS